MRKRPPTVNAVATRVLRSAQEAASPRPPRSVGSAFCAAAVRWAQRSKERQRVSRASRTQPRNKHPHKHKHKHKRGGGRSRRAPAPHKSQRGLRHRATVGCTEARCRGPIAPAQVCCHSVHGCMYYSSCPLYLSNFNVQCIFFGGLPLSIGQRNATNSPSE